jgi:hypothetical protein
LSQSATATLLAGISLLSWCPLLDIATIQELCRKIVDESDPLKAHRLITELRETISVDSNEARMRLSFMAEFLKKAESPNRNTEAGSSETKSDKPQT